MLQKSMLEILILDPFSIIYISLIYYRKLYYFLFYNLNFLLYNIYVHTLKKRLSRIQFEDSGRYILLALDNFAADRANKFWK